MTFCSNPVANLRNQHLKSKLSVSEKLPNKHHGKMVRGPEPILMQAGTDVANFLFRP